MLKPGLRTSEKFNRCSWIAQSAYVRLLMMVDDYGRYLANPRLLRSELFPLGDCRGADVSSVEIETVLCELERNSLVVLYESESKSYLYITSWNERARVVSKYPDPMQPETVPAIASNSPPLLTSPPSPSPSPSPSPVEPTEAATPPADAAPVKFRKPPSDKQKAAWRLHQFHGNIEVLWKARWRSFFPTIEPRITGPDFNRMDSFITLNPDVKASQIVDLAAAAWKRKIAGDKSFLMKNSNSLAFICSNYTQIEAELKNETHSTTNPRNIGVVGDAEEQRRLTVSTIARRAAEREREASL